MKKPKYHINVYLAANFNRDGEIEVENFLCPIVSFCSKLVFFMVFKTS